MTTAAFLITLLSSLCWALFDVTRKQLTKDIPTSTLAVLLIGGQIPFYLIWALGDDSIRYSSEYITPGLLCILSNLFGNIGFLLAIKMSQMSLSIPMLTLTPAFSALISYFAMDESLSVKQIIGISLIVLGSLSIQGAALFRFLRTKHSKEARDNYIGILLMTFVALSWSFTATLDKISIGIVSPSIHALSQCVGLSLAILIYLYWRRMHTSIFKIHRKNILIYFLALFAGVAALSSQLLALQNMYVGLFEASKRSAGIIFSIILGYAFFKEEIKSSKIISCGVIAFGVWFLFLT